ncbi:hypothetical protein LTR66_000398 [Elasticomyces elasticus]|nr:hypothetical protein LTR66_000398 [Elasticomyces elasticus]
MSSTFDVRAARKHFPALDKDQVYFDNAGGSQVLQEVIDAIQTYLSTTNVQLGASYKVAEKSTEAYKAGCAAAAKYVNTSPEEIVLGPSTTQLFRNLSFALYDHLSPGSEIVLSKLDHEANVAAWLQLAQWRDLTVKWWSSADTKNPRLDPNDLRKLMSDKTKLVACTHTSNILGTITDIKRIAQTVHDFPHALLAVDAVAYAPHRQVDVKDLEVDFYAFSWYKVYGPHMAVLYAKKSTQDTYMRSLGHYFKPTGSLEDKLGLAAASYELTASIPRVCEYLASTPWNVIAEHEEKLQEILLSYLRSKPDAIQIWGEPSADSTKRVPVISFTVRGRSSREVVELVERKSDFGFRWGAFYSNRLVKDVLGLDEVDGVVRVSLVHYNTEEEVRGFVETFDETVFFK